MNTVRVEVLNLATFEWLEYEFVGARPGFTLVRHANGETWFANSGVRFPQPTN